MEAGRIQWGGESNRDRLYPRIVRCTPSATLRGVVLCDRAELVQVHWVNARSSPHLSPSSACSGCQARTRWRLVAYLAVWIYGLRNWVIVEVPEEATYEERDTLSGARGSIRGLIVNLRRTRPSHNGRVSLTWEPALNRTEELPEAPDLRAALCQVWSANHGEKEGKDGQQA